jgi:hypothetical protein
VSVAKESLPPGAGGGEGAEREVKKGLIEKII